MILIEFDSSISNTRSFVQEVLELRFLLRLINNQQP